MQTYIIYDDGTSSTVGIALSAVEGQRCEVKVEEMLLQKSLQSVDNHDIMSLNF